MLTLTDHETYLKSMSSPSLITFTIGVACISMQVARISMQVARISMQVACISM
ncbi:hypothetical protein LGQ02_09875 [Bacillus shivajii]|uniref:hypothetical protein n=1 Tax=Bacillus shivajii TaxID=1983719 RepID=UPI001CF9CAC4|nr:hypothetical protein [Bacillus shivajii]UCZ55002.1 hypothetical protein LGQ02_09875 [Bacillus shivajii]